jgi:cytochrome c
MHKADALPCGTAQPTISPFEEEPVKRLALTLALAFALAVTLSAGALAADGKALYVKCAGCHGNDGAKTALGNKSLKGLKAEVLVKALAGYKAKTFGGAKKGMMESQAAGLSDDDMKALADYISKL